MRHLQFVQSIEPLQGGGLGKAALELHQQFLHAGVGSRLCTTRNGSGPPAAPQTLQGKRINPGFCYYSPEFRAQSKTLVAAADVVHGHGLYVGTNLIFGRESRRQKKPLVYHAHGFFEPWILGRSRWKKRVAHLLFEDANFRHAGLWRALTSKEADQIRSQGVRAPVVVAPNGIDPGPFQGESHAGPIETPMIPALTKERRRVLFLGRLHPKKGLDLLVPAWATLTSWHRDWELIVAGPDEGGYLDQVRSLVDRYSLGSSVRFTGTVTGDTKTSLLKSADIFVLPSYSEGFPMAVLESMTCAIPIVATRTSNVPDISAFGAGWECEPTLESLRAALLTAMDASDSERAERGSAGRDLVDSKYRWPVVAETILDACRSRFA